jgi:hypothetical protein
MTLKKDKFLMLTQNADIDFCQITGQIGVIIGIKIEDRLSYFAIVGGL